jgi:hypothetical protein
MVPGLKFAFVLNIRCIVSVEATTITMKHLTEKTQNISAGAITASCAPRKPHSGGCLLWIQ